MIGFSYRLNVIVFLFLAVSQTASMSDTTPDTQDPLQPEKYLLLIQPRNLSSGVFVLMPGARETTYSAAYRGRIGLRNYQRAGFRKAFPGGWRQFVEKGKKAASDHLKTLRPKYVRNSKNVIEYAVLQSKSPLTATTIVAAEFRDLFKEVLGDQLLIVIPNRFSVYVFPKLASTIGDYQKKFMQLFDDSIYPASSEIFELNRDGLSAFGSFKEE